MFLYSILELSKAHMISLFYKVIKPTFDSKATILVSDTDSYVLAVSSPSVDAAITKLKSVMDTSNYPKDHPLYSGERARVPGLLKNESPDHDLQCCVGVRSKVYALKSEQTFDSRCKGVKTNVRKKIPFEEFKETVVGSPRAYQVTQHLIQAKNHVNRLVKVTKTAMTSFDDKRSLAPCGIHSYPYNSKLIQYTEEQGKCFYCANPKLFS